MKRKIFIGAGIVAGVLALWWLATPKPQNWSALSFGNKVKYLVLRFKAAGVDGSQYA